MSKKESVEEVLEKLMAMHPSYQNQLKEALDCYQYPLQAFCQNEAKFQLKDMILPDDSREEIEDQITTTLFDSETYCDGDVADQIVYEILQHHALEVFKKEDYERCKSAIQEGKTLLLLLNEKNRSYLIPLLQELLCNHSEGLAEKLNNELDSYEDEHLPFIVTKELLRLGEKAFEESSSNCA